MNTKLPLHVFSDILREVGSIPMENGEKGEGEIKQTGRDPEKCENATPPPSPPRPRSLIDAFPWEPISPPTCFLVTPLSSSVSSASFLLPTSSSALPSVFHRQHVATVDEYGSPRCERHDRGGGWRSCSNAGAGSGESEAAREGSEL